MQNKPLGKAYENVLQLYTVLQYINLKEVLDPKARYCKNAEAIHINNNTYIK